MYDIYFLLDFEKNCNCVEEILVVEIEIKKNMNN